MASQLTIKAHDTFPPVTAALSDNNGWIDLSPVGTAVKFLMKGATVLVTGAATILTAANLTATTAVGSPQLTAVSTFTNISLGSSLMGTGIPPGAVVGSFSSTAQTINMVDATGAPLNATASGTLVSITYNKGTVQYTWGPTDTATIDTYQVEWEITWSAGKVQTVPNTASANPSIQIVADLENA